MTKFDHLRGVPGSRNRLAAQVWDGAKVGAPPAEIPEPDEVPVPTELRATIEHHMSLYPDPHSAVLPALRAAQKLHGWLSDEAILQVAVVMRVTPAYLESIASFYDMLELEPTARHVVYVCTNISCQLRGARDVLDAFAEATGSPVNGTSPDGEFRVRSFECLGACDIAPMASIDGHYRGPLEPEDAKAVADHLRGGGASGEVLPEKQHLNGPSAGKPADGFAEGAPNRATTRNSEPDSGGEAPA